ncbi:hypothetical protein SMGD1_2053 [Sulfurimonas gotlandica GD1]|uniref:Uncharacterized protein n=1 Tax=Sulfurimonas gotlandica (strain DSM 19862 / JCM 16533 / GD1) TaxID=929558 RepID=B6BJ61_SULGG|nr:hypothetical protein [Sulfurimonas gotlandica]EDZ63726.1 hypothetical protein CBGD1_1346 [Sulfurimonas gotlandica GD1]EHP30576.1 hypothetical protein SMGD1_2053 [Sulfurimonas gotlandica GD1]
MIEQAEKIYNDGKASLESLLRKKAYSEVEDILKDKNIDINAVSDEDIENLVAAKAQDTMNTIKGFGVGTAFTIALSLIGF